MILLVCPSARARVTTRDSYAAFYLLVILRRRPSHARFEYVSTRGWRQLLSESQASEQ